MAQEFVEREIKTAKDLKTYMDTSKAELIGGRMQDEKCRVFLLGKNGRLEYFWYRTRIMTLDSWNDIAARITGIPSEKILFASDFHSDTNSILIIHISHQKHPISFDGSY